MSALSILSTIKSIVAPMIEAGYQILTTVTEIVTMVIPGSGIVCKIIEGAANIFMEKLGNPFIESVNEANAKEAAQQAIEAAKEDEAASQAQEAKSDEEAATQAKEDALGQSDIRDANLFDAFNLNTVASFETPLTEEVDGAHPLEGNSTEVAVGG